MVTTTRKRPPVLETGMPVLSWCILAFIGGCGCGLVWMHNESGRLAMEPRWIKAMILSMTATMLIIMFSVGTIIWSKAISPTASDSQVQPWHFHVFTVTTVLLHLGCTMFLFIKSSGSLAATMSGLKLRITRWTSVLFFGPLYTALCLSSVLTLLQMAKFSNTRKTFFEKPLWSIAIRTFPSAVSLIGMTSVSLLFVASALRASSQRRRAMFTEEEIPMSATSDSYPLTKPIVQEPDQKIASVEKGDQSKKQEGLHEHFLISTFMAVFVGILAIFLCLPNFVMRQAKPTLPILYLFRYPLAALLYLSNILYLLLPQLVNKELNASRRSRNIRGANARKVNLSTIQPYPLVPTTPSEALHDVSLPPAPALSSTVGAAGVAYQENCERALVELRAPISGSDRPSIKDLDGTDPSDQTDLQPKSKSNLIVPDLVNESDKLRKLEDEQAKSQEKNNITSLPAPPRAKFRQGRKMIKAQFSRSETLEDGDSALTTTTRRAGDRAAAAALLSPEAQILFLGDVLPSAFEENEDDVELRAVVSGAE